MNKKAGLAFMLLACAAEGRAHETASFLSVGVGARAAAMGGAYTAVADGADAVYWNPAGLAGVGVQEVSASHAELGGGTRHDFLAYAHALSSGTIAGAVTYLSHEDVDGRDALGRRTGAFSASDAAVGAAYARRTEFADLGAGVKYVRSHIGSAEAETAAFDAGARREFGSLAVGAAVRGAGPGLKYDSERDDLPLRLALGAAWLFAGGHRLAAEIADAPRGSGTDGGVGGEFRVADGFVLRAGYTTLNRNGGGEGFEALDGLTMGLGWRGTRFALDYAAAPMGGRGSAHVFTLGARW